MFKVFSISSSLWLLALSHALLSLADMFFECFIVDTNNVTQMSKRGHCFSCYCRRFLLPSPSIVVIVVVTAAAGAAVGAGADTVVFTKC